MVGWVKMVWDGYFQVFWRIYNHENGQLRNIRKRKQLTFFDMLFDGS